MKPAPFEFRRPTSLAEALDLLAESGDDAKPIAGGQSLIPLLAMRLAQPAVLVDLERVPELRGVEASGSSLRIGAGTTQAELEHSPGVPSLIKEAIPHIGHFQIRNRGTIGGSLAHADPAAEWPALAVVLGADLVVASAARGIRRVPAGEFFLGALMTALEPDELIVEVVIPNTETAGALEEVERRPGDFALVGAMACGSRAVVFGAGWRPQRLVELEDLSRSGATDAELRAAAEIVIEAVDDIHASAAYRKRVGAQLIVEVTRRASA